MGFNSGFKGLML